MPRMCFFIVNFEHPDEGQTYLYPVRQLSPAKLQGMYKLAVQEGTQRHKRRNRVNVKDCGSLVFKKIHYAIRLFV